MRLSTSVLRPVWVSANANVPWERHWGVEGDRDYAWIAPVVVAARNCARRDAGCGQRVVLRWVEAGVKGMDSTGYGAEPARPGERGRERNGCEHRVTMPGSVNRRRMRGARPRVGDLRLCPGRSFAAGSLRDLYSQLSRQGMPAARCAGPWR